MGEIYDDGSSELGRWIEWVMVIDNGEIHQGDESCYEVVYIAFLEMIISELMQFNEMST